MINEERGGWCDEAGGSKEVILLKCNLGDEISWIDPVVIISYRKPATEQHMALRSRIFNET